MCWNSKASLTDSIVRPIMVSKGKAVYIVQKSAVVCPCWSTASGFVRTKRVKAVMLSIPQKALIPSFTLPLRILLLQGLLNMLQQAH